MADDIAMLARYPRNSRCITLAIRVDLVDHSAIAFICGRVPADVTAIRQRCIADAALLTLHPLHILSIIHDHCFNDWVDWFQDLWKELAEIETATGMTRPSWRLNTIDPVRLQELSQSQNLQILLHATYTEICHYEAAMTAAVKYCEWYFAIFKKMAAARPDARQLSVPRRHQEELEARINFTLVRCSAILDRVVEMRYRLSGQINVVRLAL